MKKIIALLTILLLAGGLTAQEPERYFTDKDLPDGMIYLPAPPEEGSAQFEYDKARYAWGKTMRDTPRGQMAIADNEYSVEYMADIFADIIGLKIDSASTPQIWRYLEKSINTMNQADNTVKEGYMRPRPFMVYNEHTIVPEEEEWLVNNGSYPSGHTLLGWGTALLLIQLAPEAQSELLKRGYEYGISRVIGGFHWQSDVDAGKLTASAAFARLQTSKEYQRQLKKAKKEFLRKKRKN